MWRMAYHRRRVKMDGTSRLSTIANRSTVSAAPRMLRLLASCSGGVRPHPAPILGNPPPFSAALVLLAFAPLLLPFPGAPVLPFPAEPSSAFPRVSSAGRVMPPPAGRGLLCRLSGSPTFRGGELSSSGERWRGMPSRERCRRAARGSLILRIRLLFWRDQVPGRGRSRCWAEDRTPG